MDNYVVQNRIHRLSKGLFRDFYSIKEFAFDPSIGYQSLKLTAELHLTGKKTSLFGKFEVKKKSYGKISHIFYSLPNSLTKYDKTPQPNSLFLHFCKVF